MAAAGFFHLAGTSHLPNSGLFKADRVSCFACHVYLYSWEPNDEPWSEHERHAMQCPFMRGDSTENIPLDGEWTSVYFSSIGRTTRDNNFCLRILFQCCLACSCFVSFPVTEGTHPAVNDVTSDPNDGIAFMASSAHSGLVAVATKQGVLSTWDVGGSLCVTVSHESTCSQSCTAGGVCSQSCTAVGPAPSPVLRWGLLPVLYCGWGLLFSMKREYDVCSDDVVSPSSLMRGST